MVKIENGWLFNQVVVEEIRPTVGLTIHTELLYITTVPGPEADIFILSDCLVDYAEEKQKEYSTSLVCPLYATDKSSFVFLSSFYHAKVPFLCFHSCFVSVLF